MKSLSLIGLILLMGSLASATGSNPVVLAERIGQYEQSVSYETSAEDDLACMALGGDSASFEKTGNCIFEAINTVEVVKKGEYTKVNISITGNRVAAFSGIVTDVEGDHLLASDSDTACVVKVIFVGDIVSVVPFEGCDPVGITNAQKKPALK